jgi:hypothetical protein
MVRVTRVGISVVSSTTPASGVTPFGSMVKVGPSVTSIDHANVLINIPDKKNRKTERNFVKGIRSTIRELALLSGALAAPFENRSDFITLPPPFR